MWKCPSVRSQPIVHLEHVDETSLIKGHGRKVMMNFRATLLPVLATWGCVLVAAGCGSPTKPSSEQSMVIRGMVSDRTGSPLAGALVEILTGSRAGTKIVLTVRESSSYSPKRLRRCRRAWPKSR